jgi:hypothetical protein
MLTYETNSPRIHTGGSIDFVHRESESRLNCSRQQQLHQCPKRLAVAEFQPCPSWSRLSHQSRHRALAQRATCLVNTVPRRTSRNMLKNKANTLLYHYHTVYTLSARVSKERRTRRLNGAWLRTMLTGGSLVASCSVSLMAGQWVG